MKLKTSFKKIALMLIIAGITFTGCKKYELGAPGNLVPKTVMEDPSLPSILVNNTWLHAEAYGNPADPMVVVLHGGPGNDYRPMLNCKELALDGYYVVFYDQRGSGLSQRHSKDVYNMKIMFDDLSGVIKYYRKSPSQKVFFIGLSWGAMLATGYINANPGDIHGAIIAEPGGFTFDDVKGYVSRARKFKLFDEGLNDALYTDQIITGKQNEHEILDYKRALSSAYAFSAGNTEGYTGPVPFWRFGAIVNSSLLEIGRKEGFNWTTNLTQYKTKVLFLYSELSTAYGREYAQKISSAYPNVQLEQINGSGHDMFFFGWNNVHPLALNYLNSLK